MKRPYLPFYPGDWQSNPKLRLCSHSEKGIWLDVICLLHDQDEYGILRWPLKQIAQAVHTTVLSLQKLIDKEILKGADKGSTCGAFIYTPRSGRKDGPPVILIPEQSGPIWYSSRMVRDEYLRQVRGDNDKKDPPERSPKVGFGDSFGDTFGGGKNPPPSHASARSAQASVSISDPISVSDHGSSGSPNSSGFGFEKKETPPKNGGGESPSKNRRDIEGFTIWNLGVAKLRDSGMADREARSFLGKQLQTHGKTAVATAVTAMLAEDPIEPRGYLVAVLQTRGGERSTTSKVSKSVNAAQRVIAEKEALRDSISS